MANNVDITVNTNPSYGYNLSRTSYDVRQEINAKVIGVLKYNNKIRDNILNRNIGQNPMLSNDSSIGNISNLYSFSQNKPLSLGEDGLLGFTHVHKSDYQASINQKYSIGDIIHYYQHGSLPDGNFLKWHGLYNEYTEYIDEVFGLNYTSLNLLSDLFQIDKAKKTLKITQSEERTLTVQSILNDFLQYDNIKYAMEKTRIGTVTPNPIAALSGAITTNINNFSGTDTRLGLISNHLYATTLRNSAQFNTIRKTRYITPDVYSDIGNKLHTITNIGIGYRIDEETGRLAYDLSNNFNGISNYENVTLYNFDSENKIDSNRNIADNNNARYINITNNKNLYMPFEGWQYKYDGKKSKTLYGRISPVPLVSIYNIWNEGDNITNNDSIFSSYYETGYSDLSYDEANDNLLSKTNSLLKSHNEKGIDTLIGRFHTSGGRDTTHNEMSLFQTAVSSFGMSHGRNLLTKRAYEEGKSEKTNGYDNPYCRTWTYHHQYSKINDLMRPFSDDEGIIEVDKLQENWWQYGRRKGSALRLKNNSVLNRNGFVNITPTNEENSDFNVDVTKCMFSIENLAWKDVTQGFDKKILSKEQIGPNGGRIMWFPPYGLSFNEVSNVRWNESDFIGRGEKIYTYTNTVRSGSLSFILLVDYPSILDIWKNNKKSGDKESKEQEILRFFAGCDILEVDGKKTIKEEIIEEEEDKTPELPIIEEDEVKDIVFYIFYPNNYAGNDGLSLSDAIEYLTVDYEGISDVINDEIIYKDYKWKYRVDFDYISQNMRYPQNYKNNKNLKLNFDLNKIKSFDFFNDATSSFYNIINGNELSGKIITKATIQGFASSHGKEENNIDLQEKRANFAKRVLDEYMGISLTDIEIIDGSTIKVDNIDKENVSGESAKLARCAKIILQTKKLPKTFPMTEITSPYTSLSNNKVEDVSLVYNRTTEVSNSKLTKAEKRAIRKNDVNEDSSNAKYSLVQEQGTIPNRVTSGSQNVSNENNEDINEERWEDEAKYFEMLKDNDSFLYNKIVDKIKYFTPAFHSITPEGFNARLSFLHQCTRQGLTFSASDRSDLRSAGNLSFGRPPICVLRIGDFYNTRIVITNIQIDYNETNWDMNQEGIGVQPMFAKITMQFNFLGGSDIEAPISRLQNAVSFNYYANQSIYDDRADIGVYDNGKAVIQGKPWKPIINNEIK